MEPIPLLEKVSSYGLSYPDLHLKQTWFAPELNLIEFNIARSELLDWSVIRHNSG